MSRSMYDVNYTSGPLYIEALYNTSMISELLFSVYMTLDDEETYIDIGYMDETAFLGGSAEAAGLIWIPMPETEILFWYAFASALRFGDGENAVSYTFNEYYPAIFDTGTSLVLVPNSIAPDFFGRLLKGQRYVAINGMYQFSCANKDEFESIFIMIEGYWLEFHPEDYIIEITNEGVTGCLLGFGASDMPYWLLGDVFLRGYYSVHDQANDRIGFAPHATSNKKIITEGINPEKTYK
jgi:hypothetical protein